ncbi:MAG: DUF5056 domain-containing protein [Betaproteobacteria bacterium]|nr:DUF5056 domain-containing protein [Betaproteobacteria bacterium]
MNMIKDPLDEWLKADAMTQRDQYIDDAGFSLRVLDNLPVKSPISPAMRIAIPFGFTMVAAVFVALFAGGGNFMIDAVMDIATSSMTKSAIAFLAIASIAVAVSVAAANDI